MRYMIYEPEALASIEPETYTVKRKPGMPPWRRCPTEDSAAKVIRERYPDAMPGPYETTTDNGEKFPVLLVWETAKDLMDSKLPVLMVEPVVDVAADTKQLKRYRKGDREAAPFTRSIWTRGVVPEPATVLAEREAKARFTGFIGELDTTMRVGQTADGRSGLWFEVAGHGPFSVAVALDHEISLRERAACRQYPDGVTTKTIGEHAVRCNRCGRSDCWDGYLRWEIRVGVDLNKEHHGSLPEALELPEIAPTPLTLPDRVPLESARDAGTTVTVSRTLLRRILADHIFLESFAASNVTVMLRYPDELTESDRKNADVTMARARRCHRNCAQIMAQAGITDEEDLDD